MSGDAFTEQTVFGASRGALVETGLVADPLTWLPFLSPPNGFLFDPNFGNIPGVPIR